jgi:hypothetical protein
VRTDRGRSKVLQDHGLPYYLAVCVDPVKDGHGDTDMDMDLGMDDDRIRQALSSQDRTALEKQLDEK